MGTDTTHYDYDAMDNLLSVILPNGSHIEYVTDGAGRRIIRKVDGHITQRWLYSDELRISGEIDSAGNVLSHFVYAMKQNVPEYMFRNGMKYRIIADQLGSVRQVIDTLGNVIERIDYDEYGWVVFDSNPGFVPFGFAGGIYDSQTSLVRFGARDYDASIGRWTVKDPIGFEGGVNVYVYCCCDPNNTIDISGNSGIDAAYMIVEAIFALAAYDVPGATVLALLAIPEVFAKGPVDSPFGELNPTKNKRVTQATGRKYKGGLQIEEEFIDKYGIPRSRQTILNPFAEIVHGPHFRQYSPF